MARCATLSSCLKSLVSANLPSDVQGMCHFKMHITEQDSTYGNLFDIPVGS